MPRFDKGYFPQYSKLSFVERFFLRTCCYFPRLPKSNQSIFPQHAQSLSILKQTLGADFSSWVVDKSVLDVGCGTGRYTVAIATLGARDVVGIDLMNPGDSYEPVARREGVLDRVSLRVQDIQQVQNEAFDVVFSHDSFEHFEHPEEMFEHMLRVCKIGGRLYIKFGPIWKSPYGRHMMGTIRRDRPWVHLIFSEKTIMRVHAVYHDLPVLYERYRDREGGLNQMTLNRFDNILKSAATQINILDYYLFPVRREIALLAKIPLLREYLNGGVRVTLEKC